jgi:hypothetical protein
VTSALQTQLFTLALVLVVVVRFLFRELRARTVRIASLWYRPAFLAVLTALVIWQGVRVGDPTSELAVSIMIGIVAGIVVGWLVVATTTIQAGPRAGLLVLRGSWITVVIWVVALVARLGVRFLNGGYSAAASTAVATVGTVIMVTAAFATFALLVAVRGKALAPSGGDTA